MKRKFFMILAAALWLVLTIPQPTNANAVTSPAPFVQGELLVNLKANVARNLNSKKLAMNDLGVASLNQLAALYQVHKTRPLFAVANADSVAEKFNLGGTLLLQVPANTNLWAMREAYRANPNVAFAEFNWQINAAELPNDPKFKKQWGLNQKDDHDIDAPEAWDIEQGDASILVAVIDTGVLYTHPDLDDGRVRTDIDKDFVNNDDDALDDHGHGTHVAGIIAAETNNAEGIAGICRACQILPIKVLDSGGSGSAEGVASGIQYAADQGARIINMSLGMSPDCGCSKTIAQAINYAFEKGTLIISASGNDGKKKISYPSSSSRSMSIGASNRQDARSYFSNYGKNLDLLAPGEKIVSTILDNKYEAWSGTSMATPHAVGVAGLVLSQNSALTNEQVWWILQHSTDDLEKPGYDKKTGFGRLNAYNALVMTNPSQVDAAIDNCDKEPDSGCGGCSTSVALENINTRVQEIATLYAFRDNLLANSAKGRALTKFFYRHNLEFAWLLATDSALRDEAAATLGEVMPGFRALTSADPNASFVLSTSHIARVAQLKNKIAERASSGFVRDLEQEWNSIAPEQYAGMEIHAVWNGINNP